MRIRSRSLIIAASEAIRQVTTILLGVLLVRIIDQTTFGTYRQGLLVYTTIVGIVAVDLAASLYYFIPKAGSFRRASVVVQTVFGTFGLALLISVVMLVGAGPIAHAFNNPELVPIIRILSLYPFIERISVLVPAFMISVDRPVRAGAYSIVSSLAWLSSVVVSFALGCTMETVFGVSMAAMGVVAVMSLTDMVRLAGGWQWKIDRALLLDQFHYAWPLWVTATVAVINLQIGKVIISAFFLPAVFAVYSCGAMELPVISMITGALSTAILPNMVNLASAGKVAAAVEIWHEATRKCSLLIFPCFAFFLWASRDLMVLLYGSDYAQAAYPFMVYLFRLPLRVAVYGAVFRAIGQTRPIAVAAVIALVANVVVSLVLTLLGKGGTLSFVGPSIGAVAASFAAVSYFMWKLAGVSGLRLGEVMRWGELGVILAVSLLATIAIPVVNRAFPLESCAVRLLVDAAAYTTLLAGLVLATGLLKRDEWDVVRMPVTLAKRYFKSA